MWREVHCVSWTEAANSLLQARWPLLALGQKKYLSPSHSPGKWQTKEQAINYLDHARDYFNPYQGLGQSESNPGFKKLCKAFPSSHLQKATPLKGRTSFWTLSHCFSSSNKVLAKDSPHGCSTKKWLVATVTKGLPGAAHLPSLPCTCCRQSSPEARTQSGVCHLDHAVLHHSLRDIGEVSPAASDTSQKSSGVRQWLAWQNDMWLCKHMYNRISFPALSRCISGDVCTYHCSHLHGKRVPKKSNEFLSLSASSSDKCTASGRGQEAGREMNNLRDATHDAGNIKEQTMKTGWKLLAEHFSEAEGKLWKIKLVAEAKHAFYWLQNYHCCHSL